MKKKTNYYIDRWKKKIMKGKDKQWNTLEVNENRLKWDRKYRQKIIDRFQNIYDNRSEVIKMKCQIGQKKKHAITKINKSVYIQGTPRLLKGIQNRNETLLQTMEAIQKEI